MNKLNDEEFLRRVFSAHDPAVQSAVPSDQGGRRATDDVPKSGPHSAEDAGLSGRQRWRIPLLAAAVIAIVAAGTSALATNGFGMFSDNSAAPAAAPDDSDPQLHADVSAEGRVAYACALAIDADSYGPVDVGTWNITVGDQAGTPWRALVAIPGLLDVKVGASPHSYPELKDPATTIEMGIQLMNTDLMQSGLDELVGWCRDHVDHPSLPDISAAGRVAYACALAVDANSYGRIDIARWDIAVGDEAGTPWRELTAIPDLLGASISAPPPGYEDIANIMSAAPSALDLNSWDTIQQALDQLVAHCRH